MRFIQMSMSALRNFSLSNATTEPEVDIWALFLQFVKDIFSPEFGEYKNFTIRDDSLITVKTIIIGLFFGIVIASISALYNKQILGGFVRKINALLCNSPEKARTLEEYGYGKNIFIKASLKYGITLKKVVRCVDEEKYFIENGLIYRPKRLVEIEREKAEVEKAARDASESAENPTEKESTDVQTTGKTSDNLENVSPASDEAKSKHGKTRDYDVPKYKFDFRKDRFYIAESDRYYADTKFEAKGTDIRTFIIVLITSFIAAILILRFMPDILQFIDNFLSLISPNNIIVD